MSEDLDLVPDWSLSNDECLARTPIFDLRRRHARSPSGRSGDFVYIDSADWVNVIALTVDQEVVVIEQFRHGTAAVTLEIPGGMVDPGEDPIAAGVRELTEETGYAGGDGRLIGTVTPNPALFNNRCHTVVVPEVTVTGPATPDENEEIGVRLVSLADIHALIRAGTIHHALVVAAFHHLMLEADA